MNDKFKISVITPSFNSGKYIERAIKSVLEQNYNDFEHIVVDGKSTDNTVAILKKYPHLKWTSEPDKNQEEAMNKGFQKSTGDIIVYLNADDYFLPGAFYAVVEEFKKGAEFVVGNILVKSPRLGSEFLNTPRTTLEGMLRHWEPNAFCHNPVGYFYARKVQEGYSFNAKSYATQDLEFLLYSASKFPFVKIEKTLGCFEDTVHTKTGKTQSRLDYWRPGNFPYLEKYVDSMSIDKRVRYKADRRKGYSDLQAHMNTLNKDVSKLLKLESIPAISVIIPTYNCAQYIRRSIDSVLSQGLKNLEVIIVDDASTDDTRDVLDKYFGANNQIKRIVHPENKKLGGARNTGMDVAKGKYLFFLDADDWLEKKSLVHLASIAETYGAEIVACGVNKSWENGRVVRYHSEAFACEGGIEALHHLADYRIGSIVWNKLYLREFIEENKLRFVPQYFHEDVMFTTNAVYLCKKYISINELYYNYFQREAFYC